MLNPRAISLIVLSLLGSTYAEDYECVGTFIFGRHNDRPAKPTNQQTPLGAEAQLKNGALFRERYYGLTYDNEPVDSEYKIEKLNDEGFYQASQYYGQAPYSGTIAKSHMAFLQGLFPATDGPLSNELLIQSTESDLDNGTVMEYPLNGYQYVMMDFQDPNAPNNFIIKGDVNCANSDSAIAAAYKTEEFQNLNDTTFDFYQSLRDVLPEEDIATSFLNFGNAMDIFDYMNVNWIHNSTLHDQWNITLLDEVRLLSNQFQWLISYNETDVTGDISIGGQSILGGVWTYLNTTKEAQSPLINYFTGSFNTMFQLNGLLQLDKLSANFTGMPDYGATYIFDLMQDTSDNYFVQFSFKNGTDSWDQFTVYPIFGSEDTMMSWDDFSENIKQYSILTLSDWCDRCNAGVEQSSKYPSVCVPYSSTYKAAKELQSNGVDLESILSGDYSSLDIQDSHHSKLSNAAAGGIGAGVTIGTMLVLGALFLVFKRVTRSKKNNVPIATSSESASSDSLAEKSV
ncbi:hypothetical protein PP7435_CHR4-2093 [Komagataella phaffii CBS 7435]|uniref:Acid phosphatase n=2 Tax=Komagataella phaffii TaxID=460519 RepID=C4R6M7_KOMPG|nr:uncharacterized protein PAS_chr4_0026 [Komagataella phaffii GS115]AOA64675.1 GQ67_04333T0 [Komagataella phaffii]CAH2451408.1 hypothetical protein BQ9382_C4-5195 [Komagataella phaffii CBS 7435]AOA69652.1 GQ68_04305T0 [Komagataella phaffii GS115]CAY71252.1 hypothetical protein PAS_chr4_0026 [Komagataella phaffii GS115]SCV12437.1 hypothetical protein PP7435_CHR4-2093 [Komagataella phaffii CBS 7435]